jgi:hypothetical protein
MGEPNVDALFVGHENDVVDPPRGWQSQESFKEMDVEHGRTHGE